MRPLFQDKRLILLLAFLGLVALTVLAISLNQVPFREAQRFHPGTDEVRPTSEQIGQVFVEVPIWKQMMMWMLAALMMVLIGLLVSPETRKRMIVIFIRVAFTFWGIYFLFKNYGDLFFGLNAQQLGEEQAGDEAAAAMPVFAPPQVSPTLAYLISFVFAMLWLVVLWALYRGWKKYVGLNARKPLAELARIARSSLDELSSGRDSSDVIINCYLRMSDVVSDRRQLYRSAAMTPHEFAVRLEQAGLPGEAVSRLTRLFEAVRYGDRRSGPREISEAVGCLKTILSYCGETV